MKKLKSKLIALCLLMFLSIASPIQFQTNQDQITIQKVVHVDAKKKVAKKKTTKKKTKKKSTTVYVTQTGECYHRYSCGRGTYYKSTLKSAKASGLRPCKKCY